MNPDGRRSRPAHGAPKKLLAGDRTFLLDAADRAEVDRRVEAEENPNNGALR